MCNEMTRLRACYGKKEATGFRDCSGDVNIARGDRREAERFANVFVIPTAHAKAMQKPCQRFLLQWQNSARTMARLKPYVSATANVVPLARTGSATKPSVPTSTVVRLPACTMAMPKPLAPASTTVR